MGEDRDGQECKVLISLVTKKSLEVASAGAEIYAVRRQWRRGYEFISERAISTTSGGGGAGVGLKWRWQRREFGNVLYG